MENEKDKKLIITPLDESTKKISQVLANDNCRKILNLLSDEPLSSTQISEKLGLHLTTVEYNTDKLLEVGLITVHHKRWSAKGKKVNYFAPAEKYILIAPKAQHGKIMQNLRTLLVPVLAIVLIFAGVAGFMFMQKPGGFEQTKQLDSITSVQQTPASESSALAKSAGTKNEKSVGSSNMDTSDKEKAAGTASGPGSGQASQASTAGSAATGNTSQGIAIGGPLNNSSGGGDSRYLGGGGGGGMLAPNNTTGNLTDVRGGVVPYE